jgi:hypothetical protein
MGRTKRTVEQEWYDIFSDADLADQDAMLRVLTELHRQKRRGRLDKPEQVELKLAHPEVTV